MVLEEEILTVSNLGGCGGLGRKRFLTVSNLGGCSGLVITDF